MVEVRPNLEELTSFDKGGLKKADTTEKSGAVEGYALEKTLEKLNTFEKDSLNHVDTDEKNRLPTQDEIDREKKSGF